MKILLLIICIIAAIGLTICSIALGWHLRIRKELEQEEGGCIVLDGDVSADSRYYYIRVFESDTSVEHLRVPRFNAKHTLDVSAHKYPVKITIKNK